MEYITTDPPLSLDKVTLIPVVRVCLDGENKQTDQYFSGNKEPLAIIVCTSMGVQALDVNSAKIPIDDLLQKIPGLDAKLKQASGNC